MIVRPFVWCAAWLACIGSIVPSPALAQAPAAARTNQPPQADPPAVSDVVLDHGGALRGVVVDAQGIPMPGLEVNVAQAGRVVSKGKTDVLGQFSAEVLRGGVYQVSAAEGMTTLRVWQASAAPPSARSLALVVGSPQVVRGATPFREIFLSDAFVITAIVAAAIAIPVAISAARNPKPPSS